MSNRIHVRPLREHVPADNGARTFLPKHGLVRERSAFWDRMQQIGAVDMARLPSRGAKTMIRPVAGARVLTSGHRAPDVTDPKKQPELLPSDGAEVEWSEPHESALSDNLIEFVPPAADAPPDSTEPAAEPPTSKPAAATEPAPETPTAEDSSHG